MAITAANISDVLKAVTDPSLTQEVAQFQKGMADAKADTNEFVKQNATDLESWLVDLHNGELTELEFNNLVSQQEILSQNYVLAQNIDSQVRATDLTVGLLGFAVTKIAPVLLLAI